MAAVLEHADDVAGRGRKTEGPPPIVELMLPALRMQRIGRGHHAHVHEFDLGKLRLEQLRVRDAGVVRHDDLQGRRILHGHDREQEVTQIAAAVDDGDDDRKCRILAQRKSRSPKVEARLTRTLSPASMT